MVDRFGWSHRGQFLNLLGRAAESGPLEQMRRAIVVPVGGTDGRKITDPCLGAGASDLFLLGSDAGG